MATPDSIPAPLPKIICPHCLEELGFINWRLFDNDRIVIVSCSNCLKVIGASVNGVPPPAVPT